MTAKELRDAYSKACMPEYADSLLAGDFRKMFKRHRHQRDIQIEDLIEKAKAIILLSSPIPTYL